jgi:phage-related protein
MPVPVSQLQSSNPTAIIELFELELDTTLHGNARTAGWGPWQADRDTRYGKEVRSGIGHASGLVFRATVPGTTGGSEPTWPASIGGTVTDGTVTWKAVHPTYYFHNGASSNTTMNNYNDIKFGGQVYQQLPIKAEGFEYKGKGSLPRPTMVVSNLFNTITAILNEVNVETTGNDLAGAKLTRIRTLERFLDAENFGTDTHLSAEDDDGIAMENDDTMQREELGNPYQTPDSTQRFPDEIFFVDRKVNENQDMVEFELCSALDLAGVRLPKRQCLPVDFPGIGTFHT